MPRRQIRLVFSNSKLATIRCSTPLKSSLRPSTNSSPVSEKLKRLAEQNHHAAELVERLIDSLLEDE